MLRLRRWAVVRRKPLGRYGVLTDELEVESWHFSRDGAAVRSLDADIAERDSRGRGGELVRLRHVRFLKDGELLEVVEQEPPVATLRRESRVAVLALVMGSLGMAAWTFVSPALGVGMVAGAAVMVGVGEWRLRRRGGG